MSIDHDDIKDLKEYINEKDDLVKAELKMWMIRSAAAHIISLIPIVFLLGGIYSTGQNGLELLEKQSAKLEKNTQWIQERDFEIRMRENGKHTPYMHYTPARPEN